MKKIMIVDDEQISLMMTNHILSSEYQTICASSGQEAIELFKQESPDMILSDFRMPGMTGFELQQKLEEIYSTNIPFMFMTADHDVETESKGFENGAMDFIRKPFRADVLLRRVGNILQTVEQIQGLKKAADTDPMTGLLNKASSQTEIDRLCHEMPGVLMMIDLDSFKLVNDLYGHAMGDKILIRFAEIIKAAMRSSDLIGRMGGDEFVAYCQNLSNEDVIAEKSKYINEQLVRSAKEFMGEDMNIPLGASLGCVFSPQEGNDFATLFQKADKALYTVKQNGKHGYAIYQEATQETEDDSENAQDIFQTLKILDERNQKKGAFTLPFEQFRTVYQFMKRVLVNYPNYQREIWVVLFNLNVQDEATSIEDASEQFTNVLSSSLRQSDVVSQTSKSQFMVLLLETQKTNISLVVERIHKNWQETEFSKAITFTHEMEQLTKKI